MSQPTTIGAGPGQPPAPQAQVPMHRGTELILLACAAALVTLALILVEANQERALSSSLVYYGLAFLGLFGAAHLVVRRLAPYADPLILPCVALINGIGLVFIHRVDLAERAHAQLVGDPPPSASAPSQVMWTAIGLVLFSGVLWLIKDHRVLSKYGYTFGLVGLVALALPGVLPARLSSINGAKLWIRIPGLFSIQPGEFAKICLIIFVAAFLVSKRELFTATGRRAFGLDLPRARDLAPLIVAWGLSIGLMVLETDLGSSLLIFGIVLVMLYVATERAFWLIVGTSCFIVGCVLAYHVFGHVRSRVQAWTDPLGNFYDSGHQVSLGLFGITTGGIGGTGLGAGRPEITPYANSDEIVAALGEELGFIGLAALLVIYLLLATRGLRSALAVRDSFGKLLGGGLAFSVVLQVFVVVGGVTALIPLTGLTMPFLAAGGSSLVANYGLAALLLRISDAARRPAAPRPVKIQQAPIAEAHTELVARPA